MSQVKNSMYPTVKIPSGFEGQQLSIERKRKLADAMLQRGLTGRDDYRSYAQVLGQLAQAWAGKSIQKDADKQQAEMGEQVKAQYSAALGEFAQDEAKVKAGQMDPMELVQKYRSNPLLGEVLEPYQAAMQTKLTAGQNKKLVEVMVNNRRTPMLEGNDGSYTSAPEGISPLNRDIRLENGVAIDPTQLTPGQRGPQNPNADVILDENGNMVPNAAKVAATRFGQGFGGSYTPAPLPNAPAVGEAGRASAPMELGTAPGLPGGTGTYTPAAMPTSGPIGPWIEQMAGRPANSHRGTGGVPGTYHADNNARDFPTKSIQENIAEGRRLKALYGPKFDVIYSETDSSGKHNDHVHVEPGPELGKQIRGKSAMRGAVVDGQQYYIIGGKVYDNPEGK